MTAKQSAADRRALWRLAAEFRAAVEDVRARAAAIHEQEIKQTEQRSAHVHQLLQEQAARAASLERHDPAADTSRDLEDALAKADEAFQAAQRAFADLRAAHEAGQFGDTEDWTQRVAAFREAMVEVHRLTASLQHETPESGG